MTHAEIIDKLGGPRSVAAALGCDPSRPSRWKREGIPVARWPDVAALAQERGFRRITLHKIAKGRPVPEAPAA